MEIRTYHVKTHHDLRPVIDLLDRTEETVEALIVLIGLGSARAAEFAADEQDDDMYRRALDVMTAVNKVCEVWGFANGES